MRLAAAMAMYTILSLAPLLVITIKVVAVVLDRGGGHPAGGAAGAGVPRSEGRCRRQRHGRGRLAARGRACWPPLVSIGILLFTASGVFAELRDSLNAIWGVAADSGSGVWAAVRERLLSIGMVFVIGFLLLVSQFVTVALTVLSEYVLGEAGWAAVATDLFASTLIITLLFAMLFRFLPDVRLGVARRSPGCVRHRGPVQGRAVPPVAVLHLHLDRLGVRRGRVVRGRPVVGVLLRVDPLLRGGADPGARPPTGSRDRPGRERRKGDRGHTARPHRYRRADPTDQTPSPAR